MAMTKEERIEFKKGLMVGHPLKALEKLELTKRATAVGSGRKVYNVTNVTGVLVKRAYNLCGVEQLMTEITIYNDIQAGNGFDEMKEVLPTIFNGMLEYEYGSKNYSECFIIMQKLEPLKYESGTVNILSVCSEYGVHPMYLNTVIKMLAKKYALHLDDILNASAWGTVKGTKKLKLMDWGTTTEIYNKFFYD